MKVPVIIGAARTPVGSFRGSLSSLNAPMLGSTAMKGSIQQAGLEPNDVNEVFFGNVLSANIGQAPAAQAARLAGIPTTTPCTLINKVCASGLKAAMFAAQSIKLGDQKIVAAGGMESMSNAPYYLDKARNGYAYGHNTVHDAIIKDGLWDSLYQVHMGNCAEDTAKNYAISREEQDEFAIESYKRSAAAWERGAFKKEIVPVTVKDRKKEFVISEDEEYKKVNFEKFSSLRPVFDKQGTVTAANASTLNDGASAVLIMEEEAANNKGLKPLARILGYADANRDPKEFTIAPADAIPLALKKCGLSMGDIDYFEINEAFSVVSIANEKLLNLDRGKVNVLGGAVSLGHPIGSSGCRILVTLTHLLQKGQIGCAAICNGGGGASAMIIEKLS